MKFGATIRKLREEKEISIKKLSEKIGMTPTYLAPVERDAFKPPAVKLIIKIAKALGANADELCSSAGKVSPETQRAIAKNPASIGRIIRAVAKLPDKKVDEMANRLDPKGNPKGTAKCKVEAKAKPKAKPKKKVAAKPKVIDAILVDPKLTETASGFQPEF